MSLGSTEPCRPPHMFPAYVLPGSNYREATLQQICRSAQAFLQVKLRQRVFGVRMLLLILYEGEQAVMLGTRYRAQSAL